MAESKKGSAFDPMTNFFESLKPTEQALMLIMALQAVTDELADGHMRESGALSLLSISDQELEILSDKINRYSDDVINKSEH